MWFSLPDQYYTGDSVYLINIAKVSQSLPNHQYCIYDSHYLINIAQVIWLTWIILHRWFRVYQKKTKNKALLPGVWHHCSQMAIAPDVKTLATTFPCHQREPAQKTNYFADGKHFCHPLCIWDAFVMSFSLILCTYFLFGLFCLSFNLVKMSLRTLTCGNMLPPGQPRGANGPAPRHTQETSPWVCYASTSCLTDGKSKKHSKSPWLF